VHTETERETILITNSLTKQLHDVSYGGTHGENSQPFGDWVVEEKGVEKAR